MSAKPRIGPPGSVGGTPPGEMKTNMVSLPTLSTLSASWKFIPAKTGYLLIDTCLSTTSNFQTGVQTGLGVGGAEQVAVLGFDEFGETTNNISRIYKVTAGVQCDITVTPYGQLLNMVLRISDFATERDGAVPNLTFSQANTDGSLVQKLNRQNYQRQRSTTNAYYTPWTNDLTGHFNVQKTLLGVASAEEPDAIKCAWIHARRMAGGTYDYFYWGAEPGPSYPYWNSSYRVCYPPYSLPWGTGGGEARAIGYTYNGNGDSSFGLGYGDAQWWANHLVVHFNFQTIKEALSTEHFYWLVDLLGEPTGYGGGLNRTGYLATWKTNKDPGTIKAMAYSNDEFDEGGETANLFGPLGAEIFIGLGTGIAASGSSDSYTEDNWRSLNFPVSASDTSRYWKEGLATSRESNSVLPKREYNGGRMEWVEIPDDVLQRALVAGKKSGYGLHISMIPKRMDEDAPPIPMGSCLASQNKGSVTWVRDNQVLCTRFTAEYPDYHVIDWPAFPDSTMLDIGGGPLNADRYFVGRR